MTDIFNFERLLKLFDLQAVDEHVMDKYPNIKSWFKRCCSEIEKYEELNGSGAKVIGMWVTNALNKLKK